jgi:hypothetical protein
MTNVAGEQSADDVAVPVRENVPPGHGMLGSVPPGQYRPAGQGMHA